MKSKLLLFTILVLGILLFSCNYKYPKEIRSTLQMAGNNKTELIKVLDHYESTGEQQKLKAAYFLIGNMEDHYSVYNYNLNNYFGLLDDANKELLRVKLPEKIDSLRRFFPINNSTNILSYDAQVIKSDFLINNIEQAFKVWELPWAQHVGFENFCEFILPYRIHNEPLSNWREHFYNQFISFEDSVNNASDPKEILEKLSNYLFKKWHHFEEFSTNGLYPDLIKMQKYNGGICEHRYFLFVGMCRSIGIPITIESTIQWSTDAGGHSWNVFIDTDSTYRPVNGAEDNFKYFEKNLIPLGDGSYTCTKIFRETFAVQKSSLPFVGKNIELLPAYFQNKHLIDVTCNYDIPKTDWVLNFDEKKLENQIVYLKAYGYGFNQKIVTWSKVKNGQASFKDLGLPVFYTPVIIKDGEEITLNKSIRLTVDEQWRQEYNPDWLDTGTVNVYRKFYETGDYIQFSNYLVGAKFQGSNSPDFSNATDLYAIENRPRGYKEVNIDNEQKFRYLRFIPSEQNPIRISEIDFYGLNENDDEIELQGSIINIISDLYGTENIILDNAFDNNIKTNLNADKGSWIGIDLGLDNATTITKIGYLARNNFNVIEKNHHYELFYLKNNQWVSMGRKIATKNTITYHGVPKDAMLLLKDHSEGVQERLFWFEHSLGIQYFW
jgi:hypothetical protein